jgi:hypothetical protein
MQIDAISSTHSGILQLSIYTLTFSMTTNVVSIPIIGNRPNRLVDFIFISPGQRPGLWQDQDDKAPTGRS